MVLVVPDSQGNHDLCVPMTLPWEGNIHGDDQGELTIMAYLIFEELHDGKSIKANANSKVPLHTSHASALWHVSILPLMMVDMWYYHNNLSQICHYSILPENLESFVQHVLSLWLSYFIYDPWIGEHHDHFLRVGYGLAAKPAPGYSSLWKYHWSLIEDGQLDCN